MPNVFSRAAPFAAETDTPSGLIGSPSRLAAELGRYFGFALATFFFIAALFVAWRCLAAGVAKPSSLIALVLTAALLSGMGWLVRLAATGRRPGMALLRNPSVIGRAKAIPTESGEPTEPAAERRATTHAPHDGRRRPGTFRLASHELVSGTTHRQPARCLLSGVRSAAACRSRGGLRPRLPNKSSRSDAIWRSARHQIKHFERRRGKLIVVVFCIKRAAMKVHLRTPRSSQSTVVATPPLLQPCCLCVE